MFLKLKILVAPLDWGLGHATRCIPIIDYLQELGHHVFIAAETAAAKLLHENCPDVEILPLRGYRINYSKHKRRFSVKIISQIPKILKSIRYEHHWLKEQNKIHQFDLVISDNRYGLFHKTIPSVILTHQLLIQSNKGSFIDAVIQKIHYRALAKFQECWIVDYPAPMGISGKLAHPKRIPQNAKYVGIISQFGRYANESTTNINKNEILVLISGPEPMRTIFENNILKQIQCLEDNKFKFIVVGGNPLAKEKEVDSKRMEFYNYLTAPDLKKFIQSAELVICRSGYSTIMDLIILNKKALLIPTPGQTEQEYLARYLHEKEWFYSIPEDQLSLADAILNALERKGYGESKSITHDLLKTAILNLQKNMPS